MACVGLAECVGTSPTSAMRASRNSPMGSANGVAQESMTQAVQGAVVQPVAVSRRRRQRCADGKPIH